MSRFFGAWRAAARSVTVPIFALMSTASLWAIAVLQALLIATSAVPGARIESAFDVKEFDVGVDVDEFTLCAYAVSHAWLACVVSAFPAER